MDVALSRAVFELELGSLDYALAPVALAFGLQPTLFGAVLPTLLLLASDAPPPQTWFWLYYAGLIYAVAAIGDDWRRGEFAAGPLSGSTVAFVVGLGHVAAADAYLDGGAAAATFILAVLMATQSVNQILKKAVNRPRPGAALLKGRRRVPVLALSVNSAKVAKDGMPSDRESFPSGDAAQAGALVLAAVRLGAPPATLALVVGSVFGRVYFGCHWAGDAVAGAVQGCACTLLLSALDVAWGWPALGISIALYELAERARRRVYGM